MSCAALSIAGFILRGWWRSRESPLAGNQLTRILPHCVDTLLLGSALTLASLSGQWPLQQPWLTAKLLALLAYIGLGMVAFRFGKSDRQKAVAFFSAVLVFAYMVCVATWRSPLAGLG